MKRNLDDPDIFFGQFKFPPSTKPGILLSGGGIKGGGLATITPGAQEELDRRFPGISAEYATSCNLMGDSFGPAMRITDDATFVHVENVLLANALNSMVRIRHIRFALIIAKETEPGDYRAYLSDVLTIRDGGELIAAGLLPRDKAEAVHRAAQFANVFLMNKLHETSIGTFIDQHREILLSALEATDLISEPELPWLVPTPDSAEHSINPDLFIRRADGFWDVYELKLALLNQKDLTVSKRSRKRFVPTIEDGIAQLAGYRHFLSVPAHATLAEEKYGVRFKQPRFTLVVGNYENFDPGKVSDARRRFPEFEVIDYDTIVQLYLMHKGAMPGKSTS